MQNSNYYNLSRETMFKILEGCPNEIFVTDKDMNIIYVNPLSIKHYGLRPEEMIGKNFYEKYSFNKTLSDDVMSQFLFYN